MHILVVEDDALVRRSVCRALEADGHTVTQAGDGRQAIRLMDGLGVPDAVVSDFDMGRGPDGGAVLRRAAALHRGSRRVLMSGRCGDDPDIRRTVNEGDAHAFLAKPFAADDLRRALRGAS